MRIFHPAVVEVAAAGCQCFHKSAHTLPRTLTQSLGPLTVLRHKHLPFLHITSMLYRILILLYQILMAHFADDGNLHFGHSLLFSYRVAGQANAELLEDLLVYFAQHHGGMHLTIGQLRQTVERFAAVVIVQTEH